ITYDPCVGRTAAALGKRLCELAVAFYGTFEKLIGSRFDQFARHDMRKSRKQQERAAKHVVAEGSRQLVGESGSTGIGYRVDLFGWLARLLFGPAGHQPLIFEFGESGIDRPKAGFDEVGTLTLDT